MKLDIEHLNAALAAEPGLEARIGLIARAVPGRIAFSTSLGMEDQAILHGIAASGAAVDVFTLDTGRHFPETLDTLEASVARYGVPIRVVAPQAGDLEQLVARDGINGFRASVENRKSCCHVRKVLPLNRALHGAAGWITGIRREQSAGRGTVPFSALDTATGVIKLNPIADWTQSALEAYVSAHDIPANALHGRGFPSIGCQPCTRAVQPGEDARAGRWWWESEIDDMTGKECGLHNRPRPALTLSAPAQGAAP